MLDASAVLALLLLEPGHELVGSRLADGVVSTVNVAEVAGKVVDRDLDPRELLRLLGGSGLVIEPYTAEDALLTGALRGAKGGRGLSLGDRACLALALREPGSEVLTADRAWAELDLPLRVQLLR